MKRHLFVIALFFFLILSLFSTNVYATSCCAPGTAIHPSGTGCTVMGQSAGGFQCIDPEPLCDKPTNTCIPLANDICGADGQLCCGGTPRCQNNLVCIFPGQTGEQCATPEEAARIPGNNIVTPVPGSKGDLFCNPKDRKSGIMTAIGCIGTSSPNAFIATILNLVTGLGGGLALALILYGVFIVTTSAGSPDKLKMGSEIITSAIIGLIFILLSVFLVNLIGINILGLPGLS